MSERETNTIDLKVSPEEFESNQSQQKTHDTLGRATEQDEGSDLDTDTELSHEDLHELSRLYLKSFWHCEDLDEIEEAMKYGKLALSKTQDGHPDLPLRHANLGVIYSNRFGRLGELSDMEKSLEHNRRALELTPDGHSNKSRFHSNLGISYTHRFQYLDELDDLEKSILHSSRALELTPDGEPGKSTLHSNLGIFYGDRFSRLGNPDDLERSFAHKTCALELTFDDHPDKPIYHHNLGASYSDRFQLLGDLGDLERAMKHYSRALELTPEGHPHKSRCHSNLGIAYSDRFQRMGDLGDLGDLEKAIAHNTRALELTPDDHPDRSSRHSILGVTYNYRFQRLGDLGDVEKAIEHGCRALELTPDGHPDKSMWLSNLANSYRDRFQRLGRLSDLGKANECYSLALELTPDGHPDKSLRHSNLGLSYADRFERLGYHDDLDKAIEHYSRALELTTDDHPNNSALFSNLGIAYDDRFQDLGDLDDLKKAIEHNLRALELTPDDHPDKASRHSNLGVAHIHLYNGLGNLDDLEKAFEHGSRALELTPDRHPQMHHRHRCQAEIYFSQYQHTRNHSHLQKAMDSFREASRLLVGAPRSIFRHALRWARVASTHNSKSPDCMEAYQTAISLLPQFVWVGAATSQQYDDLSTTKNLAVSAALTAILHSNHKLALEWLEHARCVVWTHTVMLRSPVDELQSSHPDLAYRLQAVAERLHSDSSGPFVRQTISSSADPDSVSQDRYRLAREYDSLIAHIRTLPGYKDFLLPMKADRHVLAAQTGPIAVINCHADQCDALLILPGLVDITYLPLPSFTQGKARSARSNLESALRAKGIRERGFKTLGASKRNEDIGHVLASLWHHIVKPVLDLLGYTNTTAPNNLPHITWCPTGALSFLPLHAAGDYDQQGSRVFDYVISSYTPTLTALLASSSTTLDSASRVLVVGQTHTPGHSPLPGTAKELELVGARLQNRVEYSQLVGEQATMTQVLEAMEQHDWVHLACHAHQNITDPTKSGFHLHDGTLDLASISRQSFKNKGLAFLSACQTATGDEKLPDEAIHLASGMLMAGYPSVIATMWSVMDSDAPVVADKVYTELMKDGKVGSGEAGKALHDAVAALREKVGEKAFERWVPYIHIGK